MGYRYWALGHIHKRWVDTGSCSVVMPGIPQGRDISESGPKSVSLVAIHDDGQIEIEERNVSLAQFERVGVSVAGVSRWEDISKAIEGQLIAAQESAAAPHLVARVRITGSTGLAWRIRQDLDLLQENAKMWATARGTLWFEKMEADCRPPPPAAGETADPLTELTRVVDDEVLASPAFKQEALGIMQELKKQLPPELRHKFGADEASTDALTAALAREGAADALARLQRTGSED